jgi:hypothetical protein
MTRILPSSEADWTSGERLFVRTVTQYPARVTLGRLVMEAVKLGIACFCLGAVVALIVAVAP